MRKVLWNHAQFLCVVTYLHYCLYKICICNQSIRTKQCRNNIQWMPRNETYPTLLSQHSLHWPIHQKMKTSKTKRTHVHQTKKRQIRHTPSNIECLSSPYTQIIWTITPKHQQQTLQQQRRRKRSEDAVAVDDRNNLIGNTATIVIRGFAAQSVTETFVIVVAVVAVAMIDVSTSTDISVVFSSVLNVHVKHLLI